MIGREADMESKPFEHVDKAMLNYRSVMIKNELTATF